jgi:hypothetical protein
MSDVRTPAALLAAGVLLVAPLTPAVAQRGDPFRALDACADGARAAWKVPGLAVAIVRNDSIVYARGFGVRELGKPDRVNERTVFAIGSASKAFTAAASAGGSTSPTPTSYQTPPRDTSGTYEAVQRPPEPAPPSVSLDIGPCGTRTSAVSSPLWRPAPLTLPGAPSSGPRGSRAAPARTPRSQ